MFHVSAADHQRPTHPRLHLRDVRDAQIVLEAVRLGYLQIVTRRLNEAERSGYIKSGSVFVWEESDDELGLKRWTDGRFWSQSRMREPFLFYEERVVDRVPNEPRAASSASPTASSRSSGGLVKQTYSAFVHGQGGPKPRKLHVTAYLTYADVPSLPTVDMEPSLRSLAIPGGVYRSAKARSRQVDVENTYAAHGGGGGGSSSSSAPPTPGGTIPPAPSLSPQHYAAHFTAPHPHSPTSPYAHSSTSYGFPSPGAAPAAPPRYAYTPAPAGGYPTTPALPHTHSLQTGAAGMAYGYGASAYGSSYAAVPRDASPYGNSLGGLPGQERRPDEDQRLISMLNARHVV